MDYSIYDALEAGFDKVVFVIRKDLEKDFKEIIGNRIEKEVEVAYAFQELDDIPEKFSGKFTGRTKPWGTGQAILCCKDVVDAPFLVINADDYYGKEAFKEARNTKGKPTCIVAKTIKGKGVSFMENQVGWHVLAVNCRAFRRANQRSDQQ